MASLTLTGLGQFVRNIYMDGITSSVVIDSRLWALLPKATSQDITFGGASYAGIFASLLELGDSSGWREENDASGLPAYNREEQVRQGSVSPAYLYGKFQMTAPALFATSVKDGTFAKSVNFWIQATLGRMKRDMAQAGWGDGTGNVAQITAATWAALVNPVVAGTAITVSSTKLLDVGMVIDGFDDPTAGAQIINSNRITAIDRVNKTIKLSANVANAGPNALTFVSREDSRGHHPNGLENLVDGPDSAGVFTNSTLHTISGSTFAQWAATVLSNAGVNVPLDLLTMQQILDLSEENAQGRPNLIITDYGVRRSYINELSADRRYIATETLKLPGGFTALEYNGGADPLPVTADRYAPQNKMWFIDTRHIMWGVAHEFDFVDSPAGSIFDTVIESGVKKHAYESTIFAFLQLFTKKRNAHAVWRDVE